MFLCYDAYVLLKIFTDYSFIFLILDGIYLWLVGFLTEITMHKDQNVFMLEKPNTSSSLPPPFHLCFFSFSFFHPFFLFSSLPSFFSFFLSLFFPFLPFSSSPSSFPPLPFPRISKVVCVTTKIMG